jgi:hypothetical protein
MLRPLLLSAAAALALAACSTTTDAPAGTSTPAAEVSTSTSPVQLALQTADELSTAGNTPAAIQRLMQLVGDTSLTPNEQAGVLVRLGDLSMAPGGYNAQGAVGYYGEVISDHKGTPSAADAAARLPLAEAKVTAYRTKLDSADASRSEQFLALMNLGMHQDAIDLMVANDLTPDNEELLAMYQIGYLCDDPNLTGRSYSVNDRDGTVRNLRFCDFGK